ncbi:hypothetical protein [Halobellus limi]|uniref:Uncharacterized protein n=1 Tax=Halobellus limi TaxID=699433 RepID=A0A1H5SQH5_9EURY|nr:hypothetical protein [Halobellus limi]QCC47534.1 hypothetical protein DV707_07585 [Halobellus limi]SEF52208.1 hypothetical protein SAMN04488133_0029 [Halobellus limi]
MNEANASAGIGNDPETAGTDSAEDVSTSRLPTGGLDDTALEETGADLAFGLIVGGVGVTAWSLPSSTLAVAAFALSGVLIMFANDRRIRLVGPFILGASLFAVVSGLAATFVTAAVYALVAALYHHRLIDVEEVI